MALGGGVSSSVPARAGAGDDVPRESAPSAAGRHESLHHIPALDGVRGVAIALVLASHLTGTLRAPIYSGLSSVIGLGWAGVDLFFALSGFLITSILLRTRASPDYFKSFYAHRALRIWPLYFTCVAVAFFALHFLAKASAYHALASAKGQFAADPVADLSMLPFYIVLVQNFFLTDVGGFSVLAATWSLCVEEHFYLAWPLVVRLVTPGRAIKLLCGLLVIEPILRAVVMLDAPRLPPLWPHWIIYHFTFFHLDGIAAGALLALAGHESLRVGHRQLWIATTVCLAAFLALNLAPALEFARETFSFSLIAIASAGFIQLAIGGVGARVLASAPLRYLGRISFGLYLLHDPIINLLSSHSLMARVHAPTAVVEVVFAVAGVAGSLLVATLSREFFEEWFLRLKRRRPPLSPASPRHAYS